MKSSKIKVIAVLLMTALTFAGCGDALYALTPEEESIVVSYASQIVAKYNTYQHDGEVFVMKEILEEEEQPEEEAEEDLSTQEPSEDEEIPDMQIQGDMSLKSPDSIKQEDETNQENAATVGEALGLGSVRVDYSGSSLCTTYVKSDVYAVDAPADRQLLVVNMKLVNQSTQEAAIDLLSLKPVFQAVINETETAVMQTTILPNDLSTYQGKIAAGASADAVLLFEVPKEIQEITSLQLKMIVNGERFAASL